MTERGRLVIRNPAEAVAISKCWLATWARRAGEVGLPPTDSYHPATCAYCELPRDFLIRALEEFAAWANIDKVEDLDSPLRLEVEQFLAMPKTEQERLVAKAAGNGRMEIPPKDAWWTD